MLTQDSGSRSCRSKGSTPIAWQPTADAPQVTRHERELLNETNRDEGSGPGS